MTELAAFAFVLFLVAAGAALGALLVWVFHPPRPLDVTPEAQLRRVARHLDHRHIRGSDSLNPTPVRSVDSMTPDEQAQSPRYSATDFDD